MQLIAAKEKTQGAYIAAIVVTMKPRSHTYWRTPGDAGVPPVFAFQGSTNIARTDVLFPAPSRLSEDGLDAYGYADRAIFPVLVTPADPSKPSALHADLALAVCGSICVPVKASVDLTLPPDSHSPEQDALEQDALVRAALADVPRPLSSSDAQDIAVTRLAGTPKPTWTIAWRGQEAIGDLFAEAPDGFEVATKAGTAPATWTLTASPSSADRPPAPTVPVTLTLTGKHRSYWVVRTLDLSAPRP